MAKSRSIGGIYAELSLRDGKFKAGLKASAVAMKRFGVASAKYAGAGLAAATVASTAALTAGTLKTLDQVDALGDLSAQTGVAVADMMVMQRAYADGGRAAEMAGKDIGKMQKSLVEAASGKKDPFAAIGLSAQGLLKMDPAQQFREIGAAIMRIQNPAERTAKAMEIFGKGSMGLTTVFEGLPDAARALGRMPELAQKFAGAMGEANDLIGHLPIKSDQFFTGFTAGIIGQLLPNLEKIDNYDFTNIGESLGSGLAVAFQSLTDGSVWELFRLQGERAITMIQKGESMNGWSATINAVFDGIMSTWGDGYNFADSFDKYAQAGQGANKEIIDDLDKRIGEIQNGIFQKYRDGQAVAAAKSGKDPITNPINGLAAALAEKEKAAKATVPEKMQVNDYQRRGLSLDANGGMVAKQDKQQQTLLDIYKMIERIAASREPRTY